MTPNSNLNKNNKENKFSDFLSDIVGNIKDEESELYKLIKDYMDKTKDLELKTDIKNPYHFASLKMFEKSLREKNLTKSANFINDLIDYLMLYQISHNRLGRKEFGEMIKRIGNTFGEDYNDSSIENNGSNRNRRV